MCHRLYALVAKQPGDLRAARVDAAHVDTVEEARPVPGGGGEADADARLDGSVGGGRAAPRRTEVPGHSGYQDDRGSTQAIASRFLCHQVRSCRAPPDKRSPPTLRAEVIC